MSGARCPTHDLALDPGGLCIVCRREAEAQRGALRQLEAGANRRPWGALAGTLLTVGVLFAVVGFTLAEPPDPVTPLVRLGEPTEDTSRRALGEKSQPAAEARRGGAATSRNAEAPARAAAVAITLYSADWCPACQKAKRYLRSKGIRFTEIDVDRNPTAAQRLRRLNPKGTIPTFEIGGVVQVGFNPARLEQARARAAQR